ncbi:MAG: sugar phosphate isomerase/epimerase family protein [Candidatus Latescibacterota bacterium]|nr:sugar phosphate isomerase/epimerase family protein [Candidatus Latescibacterota bacterium]
MAFQYCLNTSTIRSKGATVLDAIDTAANAGYHGIEPWVSELDELMAGGGQLEQVRDHAASRGVQIVNLIAFPEWAVPEDNRRRQGLEELERCLDMARTLRCPYLAVPPMGIHDRQVDLLTVALRFATVVDICKSYGVSPLLEYWGIAKTLGRTGEALFVAAECGRPGVQLLADIFHMYKGSGHLFGFEHFGPGRLGLVHVNDYPADPNRDAVTDADRIFPGDGLAPWSEITSSLNHLSFESMLSLELFNQSYWDMGPQAAAEEGLRKLRGCVEVE